MGNRQPACGCAWLPVCHTGSAWIIIRGGGLVLQHARRVLKGFLREGVSLAFSLSLEGIDGRCGSSYSRLLGVECCWHAAHVSSPDPERKCNESVCFSSCMHVRACALALLDWQAAPVDEWAGTCGRANQLAASGTAATSVNFPTWQRVFQQQVCNLCMHQPTTSQPADATVTPYPQPTACAGQGLHTCAVWSLKGHSSRTQGKGDSGVQVQHQDHTAHTWAHTLLAPSSLAAAPSFTGASCLMYRPAAAMRTPLEIQTISVLA